MTAAHDIHFREGEEFLAEVFERGTDMIHIFINDQEAVMSFGIVM